jgi:hypothetical protein
MKHENWVLDRFCKISTGTVWHPMSSDGNASPLFRVDSWQFVLNRAKNNNPSTTTKRMSRVAKTVRMPEQVQAVVELELPRRLVPANVGFGEDGSSCGKRESYRY